MRRVLRGALALTIAAAAASGDAQAQVVQEIVVPVRSVNIAAPAVVIDSAEFARGSTSLVVYKDDLYGPIRYLDLATMAGGAVPTQTGTWDFEPDVHARTVVFRRTASDGSGTRGIYAYRVGSLENPVEIAGATEGGWGYSPRIEGSTVAWSALFADSQGTAEIVIHDLDSATTRRLTNDTFHDFEPTVGSGGRVVSWTKCEGFHTRCSIWVATRDAAGAWSAQALAPAPTPLLPSSNGELVAWHNFYTDGYEADLVWTTVAGGPIKRLALADTFDYNPVFAGSLIAYTRQPQLGTSDVYVYDVATGINHQLTDTPDISEEFVDISRAEDGTAHVTWSAYVPATGWVAHARSFRPVRGETYTVVPLVRQDRSYKLGSVVPLRLQLLDESGTNVSGAAIIVTASGLLKEDSGVPPVAAEDPGNANPDAGFRYDAGLQAYAFNLSTRGLSAGTWHLLFTVAGESATYKLTFHLR